MNPVEYQPIGVIHSPFNDLAGMPIQPAGAEGVRGSVEVASEYEAGLEDLTGFSHIILVYHLHRSEGFRLSVKPFLDTEERGLFATRAPKRPNPIGLSVVRLLGRTGRVLEIEGIDILDGTPLLDIKPYVPEIDRPEDIRIGWLEHAKGSFEEQRSDDRFE